MNLDLLDGEVSDELTRVGSVEISKIFARQDNFFQGVMLADKVYY